MGTYEATKARQSTSALPDKIHWSQATAFRQSPYRQLHHQDGLIGTFTVRLLEASNLKRSYWSALALGPVKHLGLSRAHGQISSYASLCLGFADHQEAGSVIMTTDLAGKKPAAATSDAALWKDAVRSSVVPENSNPVWTQAESFQLALPKGAMKRDGMHISLKVRMDEEMTTAEAFLPGGRGGRSDGDERRIGQGAIPIESLCLGQDAQGDASVGVMDVWIPLYNNNNNNNTGLAPDTDNDNGDEEEEDKSTGRVRLLVSYEPHGLTPQQHDICALEAFARRSPRMNSCRAAVPPLQPLKVLGVRHSYLWVEYTMDSTTSSNSSYSSSSAAAAAAARRQKQSPQKGTMRLHRNAVFVIERTNIVDNAVNLALKPTDMLLGTPLGRATSEVASPYVEAAGDLVMPAILSVKLVVAAFKTAGIAGLTGVQAAASAVLAVQDPNNRRRGQGRYSVSSSSSSANIGSPHHHNSGDRDEQFV